MDTANRIQILNETVFISHNAHIHGKIIHIAILASVMGKLLGRLGSLALVWQLVLEKEKSEMRPVKLSLRNDLVLHPARVEGLRIYIYIYIYIFLYLFIY